MIMRTANNEKGYNTTCRLYAIPRDNSISHTHSYSYPRAYIRIYYPSCLINVCPRAWVLVESHNPTMYLSPR
ncbi:hypothetical protein HZH66_004275 [Vespula vulgaris]|uniref:Uncharacterized protein n=1 Tax=Vespula vulgaris TaxID=7454 RepID=A0A836UW56_VESVU|nr:hypothetical protein HZH66_004275 [Vespula vulgaris]